MKKYRYLIVGGGMTGDAAVRGIRERDPDGSIAVLCAENHPPYNRPPLSKKLWTGKPLSGIWRNTEETGAELILGTRAVGGDPAARTLQDSRGEQYRYEKLLLATGGAARRLPDAAEGVIYFRTLDDYQHLRAVADRGGDCIVIGGGFIGSEVAAALATNGCRVTMVFPDATIGARLYPPGLARFLNDYYRDQGVDVRAGQRIEAVEQRAGRFAVRTAGGEQLTADAVVAGIGIVPDVELASSLGVKIDNGVVVDEQLRTTVPDVYAAGDIANFYSAALATRRRVEHEDNANTMGAMAGRNMAGATESYNHLPYFYSDLFDLGYEAVGEFGTDMDIVEDWQEPNRKGVVYYLRDGRVRGVLLWNTWDRLDAARELITSAKKVSEHIIS